MHRGRFPPPNSLASCCKFPKSRYEKFLCSAQDLARINWRFSLYAWLMPDSLPWKEWSLTLITVLVAGLPLDQKVVQYGPFVLNS